MVGNIGRGSIVFDLDGGLHRKPRFLETNSKPAPASEQINGYPQVIHSTQPLDVSAF